MEKPLLLRVYPILLNCAKLRYRERKTSVQSTTIRLRSGPRTRTEIGFVVLVPHIMTSSPDWEAYSVLWFMRVDFASQRGEVMNSVTWIWFKAANSMAKGTFGRWKKCSS